MCEARQVCPNGVESEDGLQGSEDPEVGGVRTEEERVEDDDRPALGGCVCCRGERRRSSRRGVGWCREHRDVGWWWEQGGLCERGGERLEGVGGGEELGPGLDGDVGDVREVDDRWVEDEAEAEEGKDRGGLGVRWGRRGAGRRRGGEEATVMDWVDRDSETKSKLPVEIMTM